MISRITFHASVYKSSPRESVFNPMLPHVTIIGRGHGATRAMAQTLLASGVYMGTPINRSSDLLPPEPMYDACRVLARHVRWLGGLEWDFSALHTMPIPDEFSELIHSYLRSVLAAPALRKGWKIPETTLAFPWIVRMFPDIRYIFWVRNPCDSILGRHKTDNLTDFGIDYPPTENERERRAISWLYQDKLVQATPKPKHWLEVRMEDFVLDQERTVTRLEDFLGFPLARIAVQPDAVGRWRTDNGEHTFGFLEPALSRYGYEIPGQIEENAVT